MNEDDSQQISNLLEQMGYRRTADECDADVIMLNTCSVRAKPEQKVRSKLGELRFLKEEKKDLIIGVCGCMAQREGKALLRRAPYIDIIMGTASIPELPMLIEQVRRGGGRALALELPENDSNSSAYINRVNTDVALKEFVPVMYGCNNFCAYCVVPYARGPERSRKPEDIVLEITDLVSRGCREVTIVGQNVNSYGRSSHGDVNDAHPDFADLLTMLNGISGLERIRFMTSHPKDLSDRLIDAIASLPKVCEHLHLPLQAGDDDVLRRMGRKYTFEHYLGLVKKVRERVPGIALTTDIMVGFPGETEEQFQNSLKAMSIVRYDSAYMFAFNARPGTAAICMDDQIDHATKNRRLRELMSLQDEITFQINQEAEGSIFEVLAEGSKDKDPNMLTGYTRTNKIVNFSGDPALIGRIVNVRVIKAHPWSFSCELVES